MATADILWAEKIEQASREQRGRMFFGPFMVNPGGELGLPIEWIVRTPKTGASVPHPWPIGPAPGWLTVPIDDEWSIKAWCAFGGEWAFRPIDVQRKRQVIVSDHMTEEARTQIGERVQEPMTLLNSGEAFAFSEMLFIVPQTAFVMNSFACHPAGHEPLRVFVGFRGHTRPYPEVITPGVFRACSNSPDNPYARYINRARVAGNVVKQVMYERENVILTDVQARGILQHYDIIGATDMLDLSYDLNIAKWFSLNKRDRDTGNYSRKIFQEHKDAGKAHDECSVLYTVMVRLIATDLAPDVMAHLLRMSDARTIPWITPVAIGQSSQVETCPARNISPLWSHRPSRQSGFGLLGIGPNEHDRWGSVLGIVEHRFHPTFFPDGWNRVGGAELFLDGRRYSWDHDMGFLAKHILPEANQVISDIRAKVGNILERHSL